MLSASSDLAHFQSIRANSPFFFYDFWVIFVFTMSCIAHKLLILLRSFRIVCAVSCVFAMLGFAVIWSMVLATNEHKKKKKLEQMLNLFNNKLCGHIESESYAVHNHHHHIDKTKTKPTQLVQIPNFSASFRLIAIMYYVLLFSEWKQRKRWLSTVSTGPKVNCHSTLSLSFLHPSHFEFVCFGLS